MTDTIEQLTDNELHCWIRYVWHRLEAHKALSHLCPKEDLEWWQGLLGEHLEEAWRPQLATVADPKPPEQVYVSAGFIENAHKTRAQNVVGYAESKVAGGHRGEGWHRTSLPLVGLSPCHFSKKRWHSRQDSNL